MKLEIVFVEGVKQDDRFCYCAICAFSVIEALKEHSPEENKCCCGSKGYFTILEEEEDIDVPF